MRNGRKLEQLWIGHSEAVADLHYDVSNRTEDEQFIEDTYFSLVCNSFGPESAQVRQDQSAPIAANGLAPETDFALTDH